MGPGGQLTMESECMGVKEWRGVQITLSVSVIVKE